MANVLNDFMQPSAHRQTAVDRSISEISQFVLAHQAKNRANILNELDDFVPCRPAA
jgi:hypothetical protein